MQKFETLGTHGHLLVKHPAAVQAGQCCDSPDPVALLIPILPHCVPSPQSQHHSAARDLWVTALGYKLRKLETVGQVNPLQEGFGIRICSVKRKNNYLLFNSLKTCCTKPALNNKHSHSQCLAIVPIKIACQWLAVVTPES